MYIEHSSLKMFWRKAKIKLKQITIDIQLFYTT